MFWLVTGCVILLFVAAGALIALVAWMPGSSYRGPLPPLTPRQSALAQELRRDVSILAGDIGTRGVHAPDGLRRAESFLTDALAAAGYEVRRQVYTVHGVECANLDVEIGGTTRRDEILILGAHYDTVYGTPGANDNASGVAVALAVARAMAGQAPARTVRFAFFVNEEPPYFQTPLMGSYVYAKACRQRDERIVGMISVETVGYYDDRSGSQAYPPLFGALYPAEGNFLAFVGNLDSREFLHRTIASFRREARFASEGVAAPALVREAGFSDQWSFWRFGYPAIMVTDTAMMRYPHYHSDRDTPDKLDYERMARVADGLQHVLASAAQAD